MLKSDLFLPYLLNYGQFSLIYYIDTLFEIRLTDTFNDILIKGTKSFLMCQWIACTTRHLLTEYTKMFAVWYLSLNNIIWREELLKKNKSNQGRKPNEIYSSHSQDMLVIGRKYKWNSWKFFSPPLFMSYQCNAHSLVFPILLPRTQSKSCSRSDSSSHIFLLRGGDVRNRFMYISLIKIHLAKIS